MITKIECFTAAIQLITAVNFTFIFTHLPHYVFKQILKYDRVCRSKFKRYRDVKLGGISDDIANMKGIVINGVNTLNHKEELQKKLMKLVHIGLPVKTSLYLLLTVYARRKDLNVCFCLLAFFVSLI